jgi:hypothetical protein
MTNHRGDRHVLALAVHVGAAVVVTHNLKHFNVKDCEPVGVQAQPPDVFLEHLVSLNKAEMLEVITEMASRMKNPPISFADLLSRLERGLPSTVAALRSP